MGEPRFGDWLRGVYASESNPHRDGMYVRTVRRSGRMNPGKFYELTDGNGEFWQYPEGSTERIDPPAGTDAAQLRALRDAPVGVVRERGGSLAAIHYIVGTLPADVAFPELNAKVRLVPEPARSEGGENV